MKNDGNVRIGAGVKMTKKRAQNEKFYSIFFKKSREWRGHEPRRPDRIRTPEKPHAGHTAWPAFPASGKPRFFTGCTSICSCSISPTFLKSGYPRKLFAGHAVRPANNFLRAAKQTGVQQHPKNTQKRLFRQTEGPFKRRSLSAPVKRQDYPAQTPDAFT